MSTPYGYELILDLQGCNPSLFNRRDLTGFFSSLCNLLHVEQADLHFWDDVGVSEEERQTDPRLKGTSAVQFILTSSIVVHALDLTGQVFVNIFSCDEYDPEEVEAFVTSWFRGTVHTSTYIGRM